MGRIKKGKNVRLPEDALPILEELREKMGSMTHVGGMVVNPPIKLGDGVVIQWALAMTNHLVNPQFSVINRQEFADKFESALAPMLTSLALIDDDERRTAIALLVSAASELGGYNRSEKKTAQTELPI